MKQENQSSRSTLDDQWNVIYTSVDGWELESTVDYSIRSLDAHDEEAALAAGRKLADQIENRFSS